MWTSLLAASMLAAAAGAGEAGEAGGAGDSRGAAAQPEAEGAPVLPALITDPDALETSIIGGVWLPRLRGKAGLGPSSTRDMIDLDTQLDLSSTEAAFSGDFAIRKGQTWDILLSGFQFSTSATTALATDEVFGDLNLHSGDTVKSSVDITSVALEIGFAVYRPLADMPRNRTHENPANLIADLRLVAQAGLRYVDVTQSLSSGGQSQDAGGEWTGVLAGLNVELRFRPPERIPLFRMLELDAGASFGPALGGDGGTMWQVRAAVTWHFNDHVSALFGYRLLELNVENDDFKFDAGLQGLFIGGMVTF